MSVSPYRETLICEGCGFTESITAPATSLRGWHQGWRRIGDPPHEYPEFTGDYCEICVAKEKALCR